MSMEIANTIRQQLLGLGAIKVMSWGAHAWKGGKDFLHFKVQGLKFKGYVKITLDMGRDTYIIEFFKKADITTKPVKRVEMVYFDNMVDIIDRFVEYTGDDASYKKALNEDAQKKLN